jgi:hypothetical protein
VPTRADVGAPATGSSRTVSPSLGSPLTIADIPVTLISTLIPGIAIPCSDLTVIAALNR